MTLCPLWPPLLPPSPHCASDISLFFLFLKHAIFVPISVPSAWSYVIIEPDVLSFSNQSSFYFNVKTPLPNPDKRHPSMLLYLALITIWHSFTLLIACVYCLFLAHQDSCFKSPELCLGHWCIRGTYEQCQEHSTNSIRKTGRQRRGEKRWKIKAYIPEWYTNIHSRFSKKWKISHSPPPYMQSLKAWHKGFLSSPEKSPASRSRVAFY